MAIDGQAGLAISNQLVRSTNAARGSWRTVKLPRLLARLVREQAQWAGLVIHQAGAHVRRRDQLLREGQRPFEPSGRRCGGMCPEPGQTN